MISELAPYLERLLYTNDSVVLPGLGAFVSQSAPASIDYASSTVSPPAKTLTFNDNLTTDDGLITYELVQDKGISDQEAKAWVEERVQAIIQQLNQREIVALPGIGRLYKNYVQKVQFLPDAANFSRENFGLPPLQFSPLSRSREVAEQQPGSSGNTTTTGTTTPPVPNATPNAPAAKPAVNTTPTPAAPPSFDTPPPASQQWKRAIVIFGLLILSGALGYYFLKTQRERLNAKKELSAENTEQIAENTPKNEEQSAMPETTPPPTNQPEKKTTTPEPAAVKGKKCILVIGVFKDPTNIARLKDLLQKNNFEVYSAANANGAQSIGVQFNYTKDAEIQSNLAKLQQLTGEKNIRVKK
jgi:cell division septation protein DedD